MEDSTVTATVDRYLREEIYPESAVVMGREEKLKEDVKQMARTLVLKIMLSSDYSEDESFYDTFAKDVLRITKGI